MEKIDYNILTNIWVIMNKHIKSSNMIIKLNEQDEAYIRKINDKIIYNKEK